MTIFPENVNDSIWPSDQKIAIRPYNYEFEAGRIPRCKRHHIIFWVVENPVDLRMPPSHKVSFLIDFSHSNSICSFDSKNLCFCLLAQTLPYDRVLINAPYQIFLLVQHQRFKLFRITPEFFHNFKSLNWDLINMTVGQSHKCWFFVACKNNIDYLYFLLCLSEKKTMICWLFHFIVNVDLLFDFFSSQIVKAKFVVLSTEKHDFFINDR